jgi:hypothetical protein
MRKLLKLLWITQEKKIEVNDPLAKNGKRIRKVHRINPFNPLTYPTLIIIFIIGVLMFGFVGIWNEMDLRNPFKWQ